MTGTKGVRAESEMSLGVDFERFFEGVGICLGFQGKIRFMK